MEESTRIRLVFKDDDILSENQKAEGLNRSWILLKLHQHGTVSDVVSHLLQAFHLHQSCPHGLLLSMSGFVLPSFESTYLLKDREIIRVTKRRDALAIEGNDVANTVNKLKSVKKPQIHGDVLILTNEEFGKVKGGCESDDPNEESEEEVDDMLEDVEEFSGGNSVAKKLKRKASQKLQGSKKKKQCFETPGSSFKKVNEEKVDISHQGGGFRKQESVSQKEKLSDSNTEDDTEHNEENPTSPDRINLALTEMKRDTEVQENGEAAEGAKTAYKEAKKVPSRSARRKYAKRRWMREMANIQKKNDACESEGLRNWKEDRAKAEKTKLSGQSTGLKKWKKYHGDAERTVMDDQPKGLLHWKQSPQSNSYGGKKWKHQKQTGWLHERTNQSVDVLEQVDQHNGDVYKQPTQENEDVHKQNTEKSTVLVQSNQNGDSSMPTQESYEEHEVVPIVIRPGHIRFEPFEKEQNNEHNHVTLELIKWSGITSKKKGQKWGLANSSSTPTYDRKNSDGNQSEIPTNGKEERSLAEIDFDKLPTLSGMPKEGDLIAYRILELSSSWTPELSAYRVGKVSTYNTETNQTMLVPVPEYPIVSKEANNGESLPLDNSLYKEDGSLEIDFSTLADVRVVKDGNSGAVSSTCGFAEYRNDLEPLVFPGTESGEANKDQETQPSGAEMGASDIWDQITHALDAKKEELSQESNWGKSPKRLQLVPRNSYVKKAKKVPASTGNGWGKNAKRAPPSVESNQDKQTLGNKSWSNKALRGSALGPTMDILRSEKEI